MQPLIPAFIHLLLKGKAMAVILETRDLILHSADAAFAENLLRYYVKNQDFLRDFEPKRDAAFYTLSYQEAALERETAEAENRTAFRFYIFSRELSSQVQHSLEKTS